MSDIILTDQSDKNRREGCKIENTREQVLQAAVEVFSEKGYHRTKITDISTRAGVSKGTVYYYYGSKADLFSELVVKGIEMILERVQKEIENEKRIKNQIVLLIRKSFELYLEYENLASIFFNELDSGIDASARGAIERARRKYLDFISHRLEQGIARGEFKAVDPLTTAGALLGMIEGALNIYFQKCSAPESDPARDVEAVFLHGISISS